jgi:lipopolysaccharide transport system ATP-binding protein
MPTAIKFENISKQYRLGLVSTQTLSHDLNRWWKMNIRGKEDPYLKIGEVNDRAHKGASDYVWALKDIDFEVQQGDVLGIIGKNGAGKSTLLKILSKVTAPTTGTIKARGRIASLLEVGTGFHPEMTGRENIYMNGAIMGMTKREITSRLDEIVDFSGVERYLGTPVKRYSSGMTVRLGFAIAAHLEPEILVVDEVLAVGDAEFQKKAIGKMQDVSKGEGRTVLFVSHNMAAVMNLCDNCVLLEDGSIRDIGRVNVIVDKYLLIKDASYQYINTDRHYSEVMLSRASIELLSTKIITLNCVITSKIKTQCSVDLRFQTRNGISVGFGSYGAFNDAELLQIYVGDNEFNFKLDISNWALGKYFLSFDLTIPDVKYFERLENIIMFEVVRNAEDDRRCLDMNWNYGPLQIKISKI